MIDLKRTKARLEAMLKKQPDVETLRQAIPMFDSGDFAVSVAAKESAATEADRHRIRMMHVRVALSRIKAGTYTICLHCGKEISEARLEAVLYALFCLSCKSRLENHNLPGYERFEEPESAPHRLSGFQI